MKEGGMKMNSLRSQANKQYLCPKWILEQKAVSYLELLLFFLFRTRILHHCILTQNSVQHTVC